MIPLIGKSQATLKQMQEWAKKRKATQLFIDLAPLYLKYGELTGIRADVLYSQSAKESAMGRFKRWDGTDGAVREHMNNFAGIKIKNPNGDRTEDHETFATIEDGVRAHFNHICAYCGLQPVGQPHDRYYVVKSISWAGTVKYVEELATRYCPNPTYSTDLINNFLNDLLATKVVEDKIDNSQMILELQNKLIKLEDENKELTDKVNRLAIDNLAHIKNIETLDLKIKEYEDFKEKLRNFIGV